MVDCLIACALAFLAGGGIGAWLMNGMVWRRQRRELAALGRHLDEDAARWDADLAALRDDYLASGGG